MTQPATSEKRVSVERVIDAPADQIFAVLSDASLHPVIDGSGTVKGARGNPEPLQMGSKFGMSMRMGLPYIIKNTVVEFEQDRLIAWCHPGKHRWRYELEDADGGTLVRETFDWSYSPIGKGLEIAGYPKKHPIAMEKTLERLDAYVTTRDRPA